MAVSSGPQRYQLPKSLQEYKILCSTARKPITVLALLKQLEGQSCVVFASSLDMTHRCVPYTHTHTHIVHIHTGTISSSAQVTNLMQHGQPLLNTHSLAEVLLCYRTHVIGCICCSRQCLTQRGLTRWSSARATRLLRHSGLQPCNASSQVSSICHAGP